MLQSIFFPWGRGIGTLGFRFKNKYIDFNLRERKLHMYVARFNASEGGYEDRSWYVLTPHGWNLKRREDQWGEFQRGSRRPALRNYPADGLTRAFELRKYFKPYQLIDWYGEQLEVMSFPCPELAKRQMTIMVRKPAEPGTLREVVLENYL